MAATLGERRYARGTELATAAVCVATLGAAGLGAGRGLELSSSDGLACPFRLATGLPCPFCGLTRSVVALGQGRWEDGLSLSPLGPIALVASAVFLARIVVRRARRRPPGWHRSVPWVAGAVAGFCWALQLAGLGS